MAEGKDMSIEQSSIEMLPDGSRNYGKGIIGPSPEDQVYVNSLTQGLTQEKLVPVSSQSFLARIINRVSGPWQELNRRLGGKPNKYLLPVTTVLGLVSAACGGTAIKQEPTMTPSITEPRPTVTVTGGFGGPGALPTFADPTLNDIGERLANKEPVSDEDRTKWNSAMLDRQQTLDTTATAEAQSPVETALKEKGRIEITQPAEWEKYFIPITAEEAEKLLQEANANITDNADFKFLLPFDPRNAPNLVLGTSEITTPSGKTYQRLGIKNLPAKTVFSASVTGIAEANQSSTLGSRLIAGFNITTGNKAFSVIFGREESSFSFPIKQPTQVEIGTPVGSIGTEKTLGSDLYSGDYQALCGLALDDKTANTSPSSLLKKNGKIAFIG